MKLDQLDPKREFYPLAISYLVAFHGFFLLVQGNAIRLANNNSLFSEVFQQLKSTESINALYEYQKKLLGPSSLEVKSKLPRPQFTVEQLADEVFINFILSNSTKAISDRYVRILSNE